MGGLRRQERLVVDPDGAVGLDLEEEAVDRPVCRGLVPLGQGLEHGDHRHHAPGVALDPRVRVLQALPGQLDQGIEAADLGEQGTAHPEGGIGIDHHAALQGDLGFGRGEAGAREIERRPGFGHGPDQPFARLRGQPVPVLAAERPRISAAVLGRRGLDPRDLDPRDLDPRDLDHWGLFRQGLDERQQRPQRKPLQGQHRGAVGRQQGGGQAAGGAIRSGDAEPGLGQGHIELGDRPLEIGDRVVELDAVDLQDLLGAVPEAPEIAQLDGHPAALGEVEEVGQQARRGGLGRIRRGCLGPGRRAQNLRRRGGIVSRHLDLAFDAAEVDVEAVVPDRDPVDPELAADVVAPLVGRPALELAADGLEAGQESAGRGLDPSAGGGKPGLHHAEIGEGPKPLEAQGPRRDHVTRGLAALCVAPAGRNAEIGDLEQRLAAASARGGHGEGRIADVEQPRVGRVQQNAKPRHRDPEALAPGGDLDRLIGVGRRSRRASGRPGQREDLFDLAAELLGVHRRRGRGGGAEDQAGRQKSRQAAAHMPISPFR